MKNQYKNITDVKNAVKDLDKKSCKKYIQEARKELINKFEEIINECVVHGKTGTRFKIKDYFIGKLELKQKLKEIENEK